MSVVLHAKRRGTTNMPWLADIIDRKPATVVAVALANKNARIVWALLKHGGTYQRPVPVPSA
jgi:transposase